MSWFKNGELFKKGPGLYWLDGAVMPDELASWQCFYICSGLREEQSTNSAASNLHLARSSSPIQGIPMEIQLRTQGVGDGMLPPIRNNSIPFKALEGTNDSRSIELKGTLLGSGDSAKVYLGNYGNLQVAVKTVRLPTSTISFEKGHLEFMKRFNHPNLLQVIDIIQNSKNLYIIMPLFPCSSLADIIFEPLIDFEQRIPIVNNKDYIAKQICLALKYLHSNEPIIIHGNLKLDNVLVNSSGEVKLSDFSYHRLIRSIRLSKCPVSSLPSIRNVMYMTPESVAKECHELSTYSDVWNLACTLLELYSENYVWELELINPEAALRSFFAEMKTPNTESVPANLKNILDCCFCYEPTYRPEVDEILQKFNNILI